MDTKATAGLCRRGTAVAPMMAAADAFESSVERRHLAAARRGRGSPAGDQIVTRLPSKRVNENPSKASRKVARSSRSRPIATSSPIAMPDEASDRQ